MATSATLVQLDRYLNGLRLDRGGDWRGHIVCLHCQIFFVWYNDDHHHGGLGLHTPADIHYGTAEAVRDKRAAVLTNAYRAHPERFIRKPPEPPHLPTGSWINPPDQPEEATQ